MKNGAFYAGQVENPVFVGNPEDVSKVIG